MNPSTGSGQARQGMNTLIVNRETFQMPADGWYQLAPTGEFAHATAGVVQVVDVEACTAMIDGSKQTQNLVSDTIIGR